VYSFHTPSATSVPVPRIYYVSTSGNDANSGLTQSNAWQSLAKASREVLPGDTVRILPGTHYGLIRPIRSGLPGHPIVFEGWPQQPQDQAVLSGNNLISSSSVMLLGRQYITVRNLVFKDHAKYMPFSLLGGQVLIGHSRHILIEDNLFDARAAYITALMIMGSGEVMCRNNAIDSASNYTAIFAAHNGVSLPATFHGPVSFIHNTIQQNGGWFFEARTNQHIVFRNNLTGPVRLTDKFVNQKAVYLDTGTMDVDYNYYTFAPNDTQRVMIAYRAIGGVTITATGADPLAVVRPYGVDVHSAVTPPGDTNLPFMYTNAVTNAVLTMAHFQLIPDDLVATNRYVWNGMAEDGGPVGRRFLTVGSVCHAATNGAHAYPFGSWSTASTNLQVAINAAAGIASVWVGPGVYQLAQTLCLTNHTTMQSAGGAFVTELKGTHAFRCVEVAGTGSVVNGFTVSGGAAESGGGVRVSDHAMLRRCVVTGNAATRGAGGVVEQDGTIEYSLILNNTAAVDGGGLYLSEGGRAQNCTIWSNACAQSGGGFYASTGSIVLNSIVLHNQGVGMGSNYFIQGTGSVFSHLNTSPTAPGDVDSVTDEPVFTNTAAHPFRLSPSSPCIDAGWSVSTGGGDLAGMPVALDGDGDGMAVNDIGAYEYMNPGADSDADGARDTDELIAGTDPVSAGSVLRVSAQVDPVNQRLVFSWPAITGRQYIAYSTTNLLSPWSTNLFGVCIGDGSCLSLTNHSLADALFFKLHVEQVTIP
jgi:hypothetical protein